MQILWYQHISHGMKPATSERKSEPPVAIAATTNAAQSSYPHSQARIRPRATSRRRTRRTTSAWPTSPSPASAETTSCVIAGDVTLPLPGWRNWSDAPDLKSGAFGHAGSSPAPGIRLHGLTCAKAQVATVRSVEPLPALAEQLERRDELVAARLADVERLQAEVEEVRVHAAAAAATELWLNERTAVTERELREAELAVPVLADEPDEDATAA